MNRALFLDRDGVINVNHAGYCNRVNDFQLVPGIMSLVRAYRAHGFLPIVVTNQAGVAHGFMTEADLAEIHQHMLRTFERGDADLHAVYACTAKEGPDRKPEPGMLLRAQREHDIDMGASVLIGDSLTDIQAGQAAGVGCCIWIPSNTIAKLQLPRAR